MLFKAGKYERASKKYEKVRNAPEDVGGRSRLWSWGARHLRNEFLDKNAVHAFQSVDSFSGSASFLTADGSLENVAVDQFPFLF